jgi:hypothetical protein
MGRSWPDLLALIRALVELTPDDRDDTLRVMGVATARMLGECVYITSR